MEDIEVAQLDKSSDDDHPSDEASEIDASTNNNNNKSKEKPPLASIRQVFSFAQTPRTRWCLVAGFCCAIVSGATLPALAFYFARAFQDLAAPTADEDFMSTVKNLAFTFMVLGAVVFVFLTLQNMFMETAAGDMTRALQTSWFRALLRQDMAYYDLCNVSGEGTIISTQGAKFRKGVGRKLGESVQFTVVAIGGLGYAFWASWKTSLGVLAIVPFMSLSTLFLIKINQTQTARANASYAKAGSIANMAVSAIRTILALDAVEDMISLYKGATMEAYQGAVSEVFWVGVASGTNMATMTLSYLVVTLLGSFLLYDQVLDTGCDPSGTIDGVETCDPSGVDVLGALFGITFAASVLPQVSLAIEAFIGARAACYPAIVAMNRKVVIEDDSANQEDKIEGKNEKPVPPTYVIDSSSDEGKKPTSVRGDIEFRNVRFAYPARPDINVFQDFSLKIESGKTVALVGVSGSGKSSAVQLLERFYDTLEGSITLDGIDLKELNVKWLRQHIGYVGQEPKLFATTIRENIASGNPDASDEQIEEAARLAYAHDFIASFPDGYDTQVGDKGSQMSGGQKQRIAIARVLVKNPKVLLLDEATSALDSESEATVQQAIDQVMQLGSMTTVIIAHRLSTVRNADIIAVVVDGKIAESGTHEELIARQGQYFAMVEAQKLKTSDDAVDSNPSSSEHGSLRESNVDSSVHSSMFNDETPIFRFRDVHFEYPSRTDSTVFRGLNLSVRKGETLALCGPSGCGKSTTVQLMECFYHPTRGSVEYKGVDLKEVNIKWLRGQQLGLVSQEPVLFDMTIEDNIRFGSNATKAEIEEAARKANAHQFITSFPDGYETNCGDKGSQLSGGQKQRIAIARALVKQPTLLLLDEATSALDSKSEKVVQETLDQIMSSEHLTCIVIAHRLSTIRNADRIAVIEKGKVREIGTHDELMSKTGGRYRRLQAMQSLGSREDGVEPPLPEKEAAIDDLAKSAGVDDLVDAADEKTEPEVSKEEAAKNAKRARLLGTSDYYYYFVGAVGALFAGILFPMLGFIFAYMIEILYTPVYPCPPPPGSFADCPDYYDDVADGMQDQARNVSYGILAIIFATLFGFGLLYWGFGVASERLNQRVRDSVFTSLLRQEIAWFDVRSPGALTSHLSDDAALLHAFAGEPIRTLVLNLSSVLVGVIISFVYMWPFALLSLAIIPFLGFGAEMEMRTYLGEDEGDHEQMDENSPGGIVVETLSNIQTVASLTLEDARADAYSRALEQHDPHPMRTNVIKGSAAGTGQLFQFWGLALMFWWGGWLLFNYPDQYTYREYLISMFALFFSLYGLAIAAEGAVNREKAKLAAERIFALIDRQSEIDPLSDEGKKDF